MTEARVASYHFCNVCHTDTDHEEIKLTQIQSICPEGNRCVLATAIICKGCKASAIKEECTCTGIVNIKYTPPRLWIKRPEWVDKLKDIDANIHGILEEVYSSANDQQARLHAMGVRAALDHVMTLILGDIGGFEQKLDEMVNKEFISKKQKEMLLTVIDAGSAAAHRGFKPSVDLLKQMVTVMVFTFEA